ncbi:MAG TPA: UDP-N-acetylmuramate dehydrogenase [Terracidiphilus sp.]|nr:UDP-N-acetylmuramate dehydrogenase [Terracidiphilus sp.]
MISGYISPPAEKAAYLHSTGNTHTGVALRQVLLEENKQLAPFTTFGIGGPARWFAAVAREEEIVEAAIWTSERRVPLFVLGGGSNVLISDAGFDGLVLHIELHGVEAVGVDGCAGVYRVAAGEDWDRFVEHAVRDDCAGIECLAGIPGTVGGTPVQNVGAYGQEVASSIERVRAFDLISREFVEFPAAECGFAYRRSRFNSADRGRYIVTRVDYRLTPRGAPTLRYADLQHAFPGVLPSLAEVASAVRQIRQSKGMLLVEGDPDCRSAGSFFKNPVLDAAALHRIAILSGTEPPHFPAGPGAAERAVKVAAAWLIEQAGFSKGQNMGAAGISSRHTLALVNRGGATAADILRLADAIRNAVEKRFGIGLEMEPEMIGFEP